MKRLGQQHQQPKILGLKSLPNAWIPDTSWVAVSNFARKLIEDVKPDFYPPCIGEQGKSMIYDEDIKLNEERWKNTLVGYVVGTKTYMQHFKENSLRLWRLSLPCRFLRKMTATSPNFLREMIVREFYRNDHGSLMEN